jgi:hypothetical protein
MNKFTPTPIIKENKIRGKKSFLFGILKRQNGSKQIKTIPIRREDISIGGIDVFKAILPTG